MSQYPPADRALWRIAELAARYRDPSVVGDRGRVWADLESAVAEARSLIRTVERQLDAAEAQIRLLTGERARQAARLAKVRADLRQARSGAEASEARAAQLAAERDQALEDLRQATARSVLAETAHAAAEVDGVATPAGPVAAEIDLTAAEVDDGAAAAEAGADVTSLEMTAAADTAASDDTAPATAARYLCVSARPGNLLPDDLAPLLVTGAVLVRREGRLAAMVAVPLHTSEWAPPIDEQARRLRAEGYHVEHWDGEVSLAS